MAEGTSDLLVHYQNLGDRFQAEIQARFLPLCSDEEKPYVTNDLMPMVKFVASTTSPSRHNLLKGKTPMGCPEPLRWAVACFVFGFEKVKASPRYGAWVRANQDLLEKYQLPKDPCLAMPKVSIRTSQVGEKRRASDAHTGAGEEEDEDEDRSKRSKTTPMNTKSVDREAALESSEVELLAREIAVASRQADVKSREDALQSRDDELTDKKNDLDDLRAGLTKRAAALESSSAALESREAALESRTASLESSEVDLDNREATLCRREADLKQRASALRSDEAELQKREVALRGLEAALESSETELDECERHSRSRKTAIDSIKVILDKRKAEIETRETSLNNLEASLNNRENGLATPEGSPGHPSAASQASDSPLESGGQKQESDEEESSTLSQSSNRLDDDYVATYKKYYDRAILDINAIRVLMDTAVGSIEDEKHREGLLEEFKEVGDSLTCAVNRGWRIFRWLARK